MTAVAWPGTLPSAHLIEGFSYQREDNRNIFAAELGPALMHPKGSAAGAFQSCVMILTKAQWAIFDLFWENDLNFGTYNIIFDDHTLDIVDQEWQIVRPPVATPLSTNLFRVSFELYKLPDITTQT